MLLALTLAPVMVLFTPSPAHAQRISACPPPSQTLSGVWGPSRLEVLNPCQRVSGTVTQTTPEKDGDTHVLLRVDPRYQHLLTNNQPIPGNLVVEIMRSSQNSPSTTFVNKAKKKGRGLFPGLSSVSHIMLL